MIDNAKIKSDLKEELDNEVCGFVILKNSDRIEAFEQAFPHFILYRSSKEKREYIDFYTGQIWRTLVYNKYNFLGRRIYKAIIDSSIDNEEDLIVAMALCFDVQFFD